MSFNREELEKMQVKGLLRLADYLGITYKASTKKSTIIDGIMAELGKRGESYQNFSSDNVEPVPDVPRYSVRIKRIMEMKEKGEL